MVIRSQDRKSAEMLSRYLRDLPEKIEFRVSPTGELEPNDGFSKLSTNGVALAQ